MAKKVVTAQVKLQIPAGKANPAPPVGPALGPHGINIMEFCKAFNAQTQKAEGVLPVVVTVYSDKSFSFEVKSPPVAYLLKKAAKIEKGSGEAPKKKAGKLTRSQVEEIARIKMPDLNTDDLEAAVKIVSGTARSMGIEVA